MSPLLQGAVDAIRPIPWKAVLDAIGWDPNSVEEIPIPHNAVITIKLDNSQIFDSEEVHRLNGKYNRSQFAWFRLKFLGPRATLLNYMNKGIVVGATTPNGAYYSLHMQRNLFEESGHSVVIRDVPTVSNIVLAAVLDYSLNIGAMHAENTSKTNYEPAEFSGACYTPFPQAELKGCKANIFEEGSYTILGSTNMRTAVEISKRIFVLVKPYILSGVYNRKNKVGERQKEVRAEKRRYADTVKEREAKRQKLLSHLVNIENNLVDENY
jgi:TATA-box binding protein (TBP) (component of TFIID and TFIIIB)